jgi:chromate transport protein ChrA
VTVSGTTQKRDLIPLGEATRAWFAISLQTFGGPAGQIAVMQHKLVDDKRWIGQQRFLHALNYCMLLPGPEAQQLAIYTGWLLNGSLGGLIAGVRSCSRGCWPCLRCRSSTWLRGPPRWSPGSSPAWLPP